MSIQRHSNFSSVPNSKSNQYFRQHSTSHQNTIIQQAPNASASKQKRERIVFQPKDREQKTVLLESTKSHKYHPPDFVSQPNIVFFENIQPDRDNANISVAREQRTVLQPNTKRSAIVKSSAVKAENSNDKKAIASKALEFTKHHPPDFVSQQNIVLLENIKPDENNSQIYAPGRERIVFQPEERQTIDVKSIEPNQHEPAIKQNTMVRARNRNTERAIATKDTESIENSSPDPVVQNSAIVKYNSHLPSVYEDEFLPPIGFWTKLGGLFIVAMVILVIPISAMTKYKETVKTQATVRPNGELRLVQAATEGRVTKIAVRNNQTVRKGDLIATIDDSRLQTQKSQLEDSIQNLRSQLLQVNAQINALNNQISAESDRINSSVAAAESEFNRIEREYHDKQIITQAEVRESESDFKAATSALNAAKAKLNRYQKVAQEGAISQDQIQEVEQALQQQQQVVESAQAKLTISQTTLNPSNAQIKSATSKIAEAKATGAASLAVLNKEKQALIQRRIEINQQTDQDSKELLQTDRELQQTTITATSNGIISQLNLRNPGQILRPGEQIAKIAPDNSDMLIKAAIPAKSIGKLEVGQTAQMRVSACPYSDYGTLKGTVTAIAPDAITPQADNTNTSTTNIANQNQNTSFYEVVIEPTKTTLVKGDNQCAIQLGMEGQADIVSKEETVLQFLLRKARLTTNL